MANIFRANNLIASKLLTAQVSGIGATTTDGLLVSNPSIATSVLQQWSPRLNFLGSGWKTTATAAAQPVSFIQEVQIISAGAAPIGTFRIAYSVNNAAYTSALTITTGGTVTIPGTLGVTGLSTLGSLTVTGIGTVSGLLKAGTTPTTLTDAAGKILSAALNTVGVGQGGTGLTSGTGGGIPFFSGTGTIASTPFLTASGIMLGGSSSGPTALSSLGTVNKVLHGNAAGNPTWSAVDLTADVTGVLPTANGGAPTGSAFYSFSGATSTHTYTLPDQTCNILTDVSNLYSPSFARLGVGASSVANSVQPLLFTTSNSTSGGGASGSTVGCSAAFRGSASSGLAADFICGAYFYMSMNMFGGATGSSSYANIRIDSWTATGAVNNYGIYIADLFGGTNNIAIKTGVGKVIFSDQLNIGNVFPNASCGVYFNGSVTTTSGTAYGFVQNTSLTVLANNETVYSTFMAGSGSTLVTGGFTGLNFKGLHINNAVTVTGGGTVAVAWGLEVICPTMATANIPMSINGTGSSGSYFITASTSSVIHINFNNGSNVGSITTSGSATAFNTSSDMRLKQNIRDITNSGDILDSIKPRIFDWKTGEKDTYGFVAQEMYPIYPQAVFKGDDNLNDIKVQWAMDASKLVPILTAEIKSLRARVAQLEAK